MRAEEFLSLYRVLEELLTDKYSGSRRHSSVVMEFMQDPESTPYREQLDLIREIRNMLTHNVDRHAEMVVEPSQGIVESLQEIIKYVQRPPMALKFATPAEKILWAHGNDRAADVMRAMEGRGFSHVPVACEGRFAGVFSVSTVFSYALDERTLPLPEEMRIRDFGSLLGIDRHMTERFLFVDERATYYDLKREFEQAGRKAKRLAAVFITGNGGQDEPLLGIVTPWDALKYKP